MASAAPTPSNRASPRDFVRNFACGAGTLSVGLGAFGAHVLQLNPHHLYSELNSWSTASSYGLIHSVAILYASSLPLTKASDLAAFFFATGLPLFSEGSSALCLTRVGSPIRKILEPAVFFGALSFIVGGLLCLTPRPYKWQETESKGEYLSFFYIGLMMLSRLFASLSRLFNCFRPLVICFSSLVYSHLTASMYATNPHCPNLESVTSDYEID